MRTLRYLHADLRASREWADFAWAHEQKSLMGVATALSGELPRRAIRRIARHASVRYLMHYREMHGGIEGVRLVGIDRLEAVAREGAIVAPFHVGPFRLAAPALIARGHRVALVVTEGGLPRLAEDVPSRFADTLGLEPAAVRARYESIDSTSPAALWKARGALVDRRLVVVYPDGNTGVDQRGPDASCHPIDFLGRRVAVRTGVAALALATGRPIVPVVGRERLGAEPELRFEAPIVRAPGEPRDAFRARAMQTLFATLEGEVAGAPDRWEQWASLWQWADRTPRPVDERAEPAVVDLDAARARRLRLENPFLWPIEIRGTPFVVDLRTWNSLGAAPALVALVEAAAAGVTVGAWLGALPAAGAGDPSPAQGAALLARAMRLGAVALH